MASLFRKRDHHRNLARPKFIRIVFIGAGTFADDAGQTQSTRLPIQMV